MPHAIIVVGNERRFIDETRRFVRHMRKTARCERVTVLRGAYYAPSELDAHLRSALRAVPADDVLLVAYFGHGKDGCWSYALEHQGKYLSYGYAELAKTLARHAGPLVMLNDCCHAESLQPFLEKAGVSPERCLLISACAADEVTTTGTGEEVVGQWREGRVFEPVVEETMTCFIDMTPYVPPVSVRLGRRWKNARIRLGNLFGPKRIRRPTYIYVNSPPNGWAQHREETVTRVIGRRWGAELDRHFFPKP